MPRRRGQASQLAQWSSLAVRQKTAKSLILVHQLDPQKIANPLIPN